MIKLIRVKSSHIFLFLIYIEGVESRRDVDGDRFEHMSMSCCGVVRWRVVVEPHAGHPP